MVSTDNIPRDLSKWHKAKIVEDIGSPEEHADDFYRLGLLGLEQDKDGSWELYIVVGNEPIKVKGDFQSHEEALMFFEGSIARKEVVEADEVCEECEEEPVIEIEVESEPEVKGFREMMKDWLGKSGDGANMDRVDSIYTNNSNSEVPMGSGNKVDILDTTESNHAIDHPRPVQKASDAYGNVPISQMIMKAKGTIEFAKADDSEKDDAPKDEEEPKEDTKDEELKDDAPKEVEVEEETTESSAPEVPAPESDMPPSPGESPVPEVESAEGSDVTLAGNSIEQTISAAPGASHVAPLPTVEQGIPNKGVVTSPGTGLDGAPSFRDMMAKAFIEKAEEQGYRSDGSIYGDIVLRDMWRRTTLGTGKDLPMPEKIPEPKGTDRI